MMATLDGQLWDQIRAEQEKRGELENELIKVREQNAELEKRVDEQRILLIQIKQQREGQLKMLKNQLLQGFNSLRYDEKLSTTTITQDIEEIHTCDECNFETKSEVSVILHKLNHKVTSQALLLPTNSFTTRSTNSKSEYICPCCDEGVKLTRHEVYRHIYEVHTNEKPIKCPYCEFSFTHQDFLNEHKNEKHVNSIVEMAANSVKRGRQPYQRPSLIVVDKTGRKSDNETAAAIASIGGGKVDTTGMVMGTSRGRPLSMESSQSFKCCFSDCGFTANSQEKLDFHVNAHINTKYKCPYCLYVSNSMIDIKRHIQKSKKHEGQKLYACQQCSFGSDSDHTFKEHLKNYQ